MALVFSVYRKNLLPNLNFYCRKFERYGIGILKNFYCIDTCLPHPELHVGSFENANTQQDFETF